MQTGEGPLYYIATMQPVDEEDRIRIRRHCQEREGWGFTTIEQGMNLCAMEADRKGSFLVDSVTALLANVMFPPSGEIDPQAAEKVAKDLVRFAQEADHVVFVSDNLFSDARNYDALTEDYRRGLAFVDHALAAVCEQVIEMSFGQVLMVKGGVTD